MNSYYAVVVIYNKKIQESVTVLNLLKINAISHFPIQIIVLDNSISYECLNNNKLISYKQMHYYCMDGNVGLSKAYNFALSLLKNQPENDIVIWFDDDTPVSKDYFYSLDQMASDTTYDVFAPIIYGQNGIIYSPNEAGCLKGKYLKSPNQKISDKKFNAINSCLAVRLRAYQDYTYDEGLFMDCVDTKLFDDFRKRAFKFCILPIKIIQNFYQRDEEKNVQKYLSRFKIRIKDTMYYSSLNGFKGKVCGFIRIVGWSVVYGIKLRSPKFCVICLKQMINVLQ